MVSMWQRAHDRHERGAAAVEFAIVLPLLILLVFGIVQFGLLYNRQQGLHAAAREGARLGSLPQTTESEIQDRVMDALDGVPFDSSPSISVSPSSSKPCENRSGATVVVTVEATTNVDIPLWDNPSVTLTGRGEFRCE
jgi:Flp pilus assembly protein TadG